MQSKNYASLWAKNENYSYMVKILRQMITGKPTNKYDKILLDLQEKTADEIAAIIWQLPRFTSKADVLEYLAQ